MDDQGSSFLPARLSQRRHASGHSSRLKFVVGVLTASDDSIAAAEDSPVAPRTAPQRKVISRRESPDVEPLDIIQRALDSLDASHTVSGDDGESLLTRFEQFDQSARREPTLQEESRDIPSRYRLIQLVGRGGFGSVYRAYDASLDREVTIKILRCYGWEQEFEYFVREGKAVAALNHPGIVQVYDAAMAAGRPYIVMEFLPGPSLSDVILGGRMKNAKAAHLIGRIAEALGHAHQAGVIHRDIKPSNILLDAEGSPKICDFGLAKQARLEDGMTTQTGAVMGTPAYMSPEQARGETGRVGPTSDIFSLGCVMYEVLTGVNPFRAATAMMTIHRIVHREPARPRAINSRISRDLEVVCLKCLEKNPQHRYQSAHELALELARICEGRAVKARPVGVVGRLVRWCARNPTHVALLAMASIATASLAAVIALWSTR